MWLPGVGGVVLDDAGRVLLGKRSDNGQWTVITGMLEPGEEPAHGIVREIFEETGVRAQVENLIRVEVVGPVTFPNGDVCTFLTTDFSCRYVSGEARVNDDESTEVGWFPIDELPELNERHRQLVAAALTADGVPHFVR
ncbi:NUDIX domain-containing protein [Arthrobacter sp. H20]|uniref:NUDIX hydrolase n=1 Tax=Arthrobacter sp. H20 TaxID=1267981 RepID=UPI000683ECB5|nr:NUDIX domain-containing protein [Arthrobacter sp. H20]